MSRPQLDLTEPVRVRICEALRVGASLQHAAQYAGISKRTLQRWLKRGRLDSEGEYQALYQQVEKVRADLVISLLLKINQAAGKHWKAALWTLEYLYPQLYGKVRESPRSNTELGSHSPTQS